MSKRIIEAVYNRLLVEAEDQAEDLALFVDAPGTTSPSLVLYNVSALKGVKKTKRSSASYTAAVQRSVVGFMELGVTRGGRPNNAVEVLGSWVREKGKGYGKKMYGYAMAIAPANTIMSDREQVTPDAQRMWLSIAKDPRVTREPIDDKWHPAKGSDAFHDDHHTPYPSDDGLTFDGNSPALAGLSGEDLKAAIDALNHTASSAAWEGEVKELEKNHAQAAASLGIPREDLEQDLLFAARNQFGSSID